MCVCVWYICRPLLKHINNMMVKMSRQMTRYSSSGPLSHEFLMSRTINNNSTCVLSSSTSINTLFIPRNYPCNACQPLDHIMPPLWPMRCRLAWPGGYTTSYWNFNNILHTHSNVKSVPSGHTIKTNKQGKDNTKLALLFFIIFLPLSLRDKRSGGWMLIYENKDVSFIYYNIYLM